MVNRTIVDHGIASKAQRTLDDRAVQHGDSDAGDSRLPSTANALTPGIGRCVTLVEENSRQIRTELFPLMSDDLVVMEFDLELNPVEEFLAPDLAFFRVRTGGQPF
jgi:hypothetical protein